MQKGLLITCPEYDDATAYLTYYSKEIIAEAESRSLKVKPVEDKELNEEKFSEILKKLDYRLVVLNAHGDFDAILGYKNKVILQLGKNDSLLKERLVYARSCNAGALLGSECMKNTKDGCFIGYKFPFIFYMDAQWTTKPNNDNVARLFLEPSNLIPLSLIKGHSGIEAHERSREQMLKNMKRIMAAPAHEESSFYLEALWNNYLGQVIHGKREARL